MGTFSALDQGCKNNKITRFRKDFLSIINLQGYVLNSDSRRQLFRSF